MSGVAEIGERIAQMLQPVEPSDAQEEVTAEAEDAIEVETEAEATEETPQGDTEPEQKHKVKLNGEEIEVSIDDLRKGYMMEADYRKKTSEVARQRDELQQKQTALESKIQDAESVLQLELDDLNSEENQDLKVYDRAAYEEKADKVRAKIKKLEDIKAEAEKNRAEKKVETVQKERELVIQAIPEWLDEKTLSEEAPLINKTWSDLGFKPDEIQTFTDHRFIKMSREAALYRKMMASNPGDKKVTIKPKAAKPNSTTTNQDRASAAVKSAAEIAKKTGKVHDAARRIEKLLER